MKVQSTKYQVPGRTSILPVLMLLLSFISNAQQRNFPLNREFGMWYESSLKAPIKELLLTVDSVKGNFTETWTFIKHPKPDTGSCFKPYVVNFTYNNGRNNTKKYVKRGPEMNWFQRKLLYESLIVVRDTTDKFYMTIDPLFDFQFGRDKMDTSGEKLFVNTRGILVRGDIGSKFSFETNFYENQARFPTYIDSFNMQYGVVPGQGRWKPFKENKKNEYLSGYDYAMASGYVSYSPNRHFNFQVGHGKHFIGDGYRSLLLSDNVFNYPFFRVTTIFGKFQYTNLYAAFMNMTYGATPKGTEHLFQKKAGVFQFLSYNIIPRIQLGLFQATIAQGADYRNNQHLEAFYFNPVIFANAIKYGLNDSYNVLLGSTLKIKVTNSISLYGQYVVDEFPPKESGAGSVHNKQGFQAGAKYFNVFGIKNLHLQLEYNRVRPYTYAKDSMLDAYSHYNQALAHPLGANFKEAIAFLNYRIGDFFAEVHFSYALVGRDSAGANFGADIFRSATNAWYGPGSDINTQCQGLKTTITYKEIKVGYLINPATNMNLVLGFSQRDMSNIFSENHSFYLYFGFPTSLTNHYYDF